MAVGQLEKLHEKGLDLCSEFYCDHKRGRRFTSNQSVQTGTSCITSKINSFYQKVSRSFTVTVNCKPAISSIQNQTTQEDTGIEGISFTVTENNAQNLTITYISSNQNLINNSGLSFTGAQIISQGNTYTVTASSVGTQVSLTIIPAMNQSGIATITITVASPNGLTATESFDITVQAVDDPPQVTQYSITDLCPFKKII